MCSLSCKVSIITVVYNGAGTIEQTIKSVLGQTYKNIEYIIIDGASTDGTQQIVEKYVDKIAYYVSEKDEGLYYAMNKGIGKATGEIIGIINSDDWYDINAVKNIVGLFSKKDAEVVYGNTIVVAEDGTKKKNKAGVLQTLWYAAPFRHPSVFVKKSTYEQFGVFDINYLVASDYDLLLRFYSENVRFEYIDEVIAYFRMGGLSTVGRKTGSEENYKISMSYVSKCPYEDKMIPKIKETYSWACFGEALSKNKGFLYELLCKHFKTAIDKLIIFGTGVWGEKCYENLIGSKADILYFTDNNALKWNTEIYGIKVIPPDKLFDVGAYILIAVKGKGAEIRAQLIDMTSRKFKFVSIEEIERCFELDLN